MSHVGRLFVFEGVDGAGKSSISKEFARHLEAGGTRCQWLAFPGNVANTLGSIIYRIHHAPEDFKIGSITTTSLQALHIAAHLNSIESTILPSLERGESIVLDRYWWSTWVYGLVDGVCPDVLTALIEVERRVWKQWLPTCVFYLAREKASSLDSLQQRIQLNTTYKNLIAQEQGRYPIQLIQNDATVELAIAQVIHHSSAL